LFESAAIKGTMKLGHDYFPEYSFNGPRSATALNSEIVDILFLFIV